MDYVADAALVGVAWDAFEVFDVRPKEVEGDLCVRLIEAWGWHGLVRLPIRHTQDRLTP